MSMFGRDFEIDLVCLQLVGMDVILGMNWLEYNHMLINCFSKMVRFSSAEEESGAEFLSTKQLKQLERCNALVSILLFLVVLEYLFEFLNDYMNLWCCYLIYTILCKRM